MEQKIEEYLVGERGVKSEIVRKKLMEKVLKYDDIAAEFLQWLEVRNYEEGKVRIDGEWTAKKVYEQAPMLDGIGVYNFLVTLRDNPTEAKEIIKEGFVVR